VVKKCTYNINLKNSEESYVKENIFIIASCLFKVSKTKYRTVFNKVV